LPGTADRRAFELAYAKKLGLADMQGAMRGDFAKFLAPYQSQIKQITDKASEFKGQPLKTSVRVVMGGPTCATAKSDGSGEASPAENPLATVNQAGKALGSMMGGLFHKKKTDDTPPPDAPGVPDPYAKYNQLASFSLETSAISDSPVPAERFEVPADWKKELPRTATKGDDEFTCPKTGS
jgi:hypothetical protein